MKIEGIEHTVSMETYAMLRDENQKLKEHNADLLDVLLVAHDLLDIVQSEYNNDPEPEDLPSWKRLIKQAEKAIEKAQTHES